MRTLYLKSVSVIALLTAPLMTGIFVLREPFIDTFLGPRWHDAADVLQWLAPIGFVQSIVSTTGTVSMVRGRTDILLRVGVLGTVLQVASFLIGVKWGIVGVAACYLVANVLGAIPALLVALSQLDAKFSALIRETWAAVVAALSMGASVWIAEGYLIDRSFADLTRLIAGIAVGVIVYGVLILVLAPAKVRLMFTLIPSWRR
jgi:PST family polysaccharide transporter